MATAEWVARRKVARKPLGTTAPPQGSIVSADVLLAKLDAVRQVAAGRWRARCPSHDGTNRDVLSIGETSDGTVLVKCFAGCSAAEVVAAVGLDLHHLFPRVDWQTTGKHFQRPRRPRVDWPAVIAECERDLLLTKIVLTRIARGKPIDEADATACQSAATRAYRLLDEARHG